MSTRHITKAQRDRIYQRVERLRGWATNLEYGRAPYSSAGPKERRYNKIASRLERFIRTGDRHCKDSSIEAIAAATERHIAGETSYMEWIDELRWAGLNAREGHTRLNVHDAELRKENLNKLYPRISGEAA